jgi:hypothetical protein
MSWSKSGDRAYAIWRATQLGNALTGLGTWAGSPTTAVIGAMNNVIHALGWKGWLGHVLLLRRPITPDEAKKWDATL